MASASAAASSSKCAISVTPAMVLRRQQDHACRFEAVVDFEPGTENEEAGISVWMNEEHHYDLSVVLKGGQKQVVLKKRVGDMFMEMPAGRAGSGALKLAVTADEKEYTFEWAGANGDLRKAGTGRVRGVSTEVAGGFTGVYFGLYSTGNGKKCEVPADFDYAEYRAV